MTLLDTDFPSSSGPAPASLAGLLRQAAAAAAGTQHWPAGALYVLATPIGNLADLTLRGIHLLGVVDAVACEDTRHGAALLRHLGIERKPLLALHEHNEAEAAQEVLARLGRGERVALTSDAGTPAVSDPGARLVARAAAAGHRIVPLPGASSVTALLSVAGDVELARAESGAAEQAWISLGFPPARGAARERFFAAMAAEPRAQLLLEAPHRIVDAVQSLASALSGHDPDGSERLLTIGRELTKQFETVFTAPAAAMPDWLAADRDRQRGEFALMLHAAAPASAAGDDDAALPPALEALLGALLPHVPLKQAVDLLAALGGVPKKRIYARALAMRAAQDAQIADIEAGVQEADRGEFARDAEVDTVFSKHRR